MVPRKRIRHREHDESEDSEVGDFEDNPTRNKKARVSLDRRSDDDAGTSLPQASQYELMRDNNFEHLQNPDLDDFYATQRFLVRSSRPAENIPAENGVIEEITCINFMCHEHLYVELGPLINFVVGMNGSGKSAVLTAITLCLGGKASNTNRGASLKSLIKQGTEQAVLIVKLKNEGSDAYQPDLYGSSIIVERYFGKSGISGFRLKNSAGRTITTKRGDVDDLIEYFQLQVDNPMNVLTQDAAKSFITSSTPAQKYDFFVKGVKLEQLDNDYRAISGYHDQITGVLENSQDDLEVLERKAKEVAEKAEVIRRHEKMRDAITELGKQAAWVQVYDQEGVILEHEEIVRLSEEKVLENYRTIEGKSLAYTRTDESAIRAEQACNELEEIQRGLRDEETEAKEIFARTTSSVESAHQEQRQVRDTLTSVKKKAEGIRVNIATEQQRMDETNGEAHVQKQNELKEAERNVIKAKEALERSKAKEYKLSEDYEQARRNANDAKGILLSKESRIGNLKENLRRLNSDRGNPLAGFPRNMGVLLEKIKQDSGFRESPVGPIGLRMKLRDSQWSALLEAKFGSTLNGFVVTSRADQVRLFDMMKGTPDLDTNCCPIFIGNNAPLNTTGHEPDPQFVTILRVLEFDSDLVRRTLIINQSIEQSLLFSSRAAGQKVMLSRPKPRFVTQCFTPHDKRSDFFLREGFRGQSNESAPIKATHNLPRIKTDISDQIRLLQEAIEKLQNEITESKNEIRQLDQNIRECDNARRRNGIEKDNLQVASHKSEESVEAIKVELDRFDVGDGHLEALRNELVEVEEEMKLYEQSYGEAALEKEKANRAAYEQKTKLEEVRARVAEQDTATARARQKAKNKAQARHIALQEKNIAIANTLELERQVTNAERQRDEEGRKVAVYIAQAERLSPHRTPIGKGQTLSSIEAQLAKLQEQVRQYNARIGGTDVDIMRAQEEAQALYTDAVNNQRILVATQRALEESLQARTTQWRRFQKLISANSRINFSYLLAERAFRGRLAIDHRLKTLDVHVEPDETTKGGQGRQAKTLSGGEKSFSSICLLLALWEAMGSPLRCLDEFDVYMDDVNRDVSTNMIISAARRSAGRQFILITPKALGTGAGPIPQDEVQIIKLLDPRESQRRIDDMLQRE